MSSLRRLLGAVFLLACVVSLAACGLDGQGRRNPSPPTDEPEGAGSRGRPDGDVALAVVGDSITSPWGRLGSYEIDETLWLSHVLGAEIRLAGGWALPGATTADMAAAVEPVEDADVLVILAGTNDGAATPFASSAENLVRIAERVGAPRVIVSSVPPRSDLPRVPAAYNDRLRTFADEHGWEFVDAAAGLRAGERWRAGMSEDGLHPTPQGQEVIGRALRAAILQGAGSAGAER